MLKDKLAIRIWFSQVWAKLSSRDAPWNRRWMTTTIGKKLFVGFGAITLILIVTVIASLVAIHGIQKLSDRMIYHDMPSASASLAISRDVYASSAALHSLIMTGQLSYTLERKSIWHQINKLIKSTDALSKDWKKTRHIVAWRKAKSHLNTLARIQESVASYVKGDQDAFVTQTFLSTYPIRYIKDMQQAVTQLMIFEKAKYSGNQKMLLTQLTKLQRSTSSANLELQAYLFSGAESAEALYKKHWAMSSVAFSNVWGLKGNVPSAQKTLLQRIAALRSQFSLLVEKVIILRKSKRWSRANYLMLAQVEPVVNAILNVLIGPKSVGGERLGGLQSEQHLALLANTFNLSIDIKRIRWFEWIMLLLGTLISLIVGVITTRVIRRPLNQAISIAGYIASGKRDIKIEPHTTEDETGKLLNALDHMQKSIHKVENVLESSKQEMQHMAFHDALTGLPNRIQFHNEFQRLLSLAGRRGRHVALLLIDLDNFKGINDTLGHDIGDLLLVEVGKRLQSVLRKEDFVTRLSGDEFSVLLYGVKAEYLAGKVADKIIATINKPFQLQAYSVSVTVSIGVACYPEAGEDVKTLSKSADVAMYRSKEMGRNKSQHYNAIVSEEYRKRLAVENSLEASIKNNEFTLVYQPILNLQSQKMIGVEALLRWYHPDLGLVMPDYFIPIAEEMGAMFMIDKWVLHHACEQYQQWMLKGVTELQMAINVAYTHSDYSQYVFQTLEALNIPKHLICLELTESVFMDNLVGLDAALTRMRSSGIHISIDDFGKGYSSLSRLNRLPVSMLKIDRTFISGIGVDPRSETIIKSIISLAKGLGLQVIAEGIETEVQAQFLKNHHCPSGQGFFYSKPLSPEELF